MVYQKKLNPLAEDLNSILAPCIAGRLLSDLGTRLYFPKGIIAQSGEAKTYGKTANATIGMAFKEGLPIILSAVKEQLPGLTAAESVAYAPTAGNEELRAAWNASIRAKNPSLGNKPVSMPVLVPGLTAGISYLADLFLDETSVLLTGDPAWDNYVLIIEARRNSTLRGFSLFKGNGFDISGFRTAVMAEARTGSVRLLLNFPQNPAGYTPTREEAAAIVDVIVQAADSGADVMVWCDDAYFGLAYEEDIEPESLFAKLAGIHERVLAVKIDGPTKEDYVWGLRTGFLTFGSKGMNEAQYDAIVKKLMGAIRSSVSCTATPSQSVLLKTMNDPRMAKEKLEYRQLLEKRYRIVRNFIDARSAHPVLEALPFNSGYFMSMRCKGIGAEELRTRLLHAHGIGTIAIDPSHLRVAFSSVETDLLLPVFDMIFRTAEELAAEKQARS